MNYLEFVNLINNNQISSLNILAVLRLLLLPRRRHLIRLDVDGLSLVHLRLMLLVVRVSRLVDTSRLLLISSHQVRSSSVLFILLEDTQSFDVGHQKASVVSKDDCIDHD